MKKTKKKNRQSHTKRENQAFMLFNLRSTTMYRSLTKPQPQYSPIGLIA